MMSRDRITEWQAYSHTYLTRDVLLLLILGGGALVGGALSR